MITEPQFSQPRPRPAFRAVLAALGKYLDARARVPIVLRRGRLDDLAWELEWALSQWIDDRLDTVYDELKATQECVLANRAKLLEAAEPPEDRAFEEGWAEQQRRES